MTSPDDRYSPSLPNHLIRAGVLGCAVGLTLAAGFACKAQESSRAPATVSAGYCTAEHRSTSTACFRRCKEANQMRAENSATIHGRCRGCCHLSEQEWSAARAGP
jgi:hypothetical protein